MSSLTSQVDKYLPLTTERLVIRPLMIKADSAFILELVNTDSWLKYIGDKGVRDLDGARKYLRQGPVKSYQQNGFGLYLVGMKDSEEPIGLCGLVKRPELPSADIGFAFLPKYEGYGYAFEAANVVLQHAKNDIHLERILAVTTPDNHPSIRLLKKLGLSKAGHLQLGDNLNEMVLFEAIL